MRLRKLTRKLLEEVSGWLDGALFCPVTSTHMKAESNCVYAPSGFLERNCHLMHPVVL